MQNANSDEVLDKLLAKDPRFHREAYLFVREGIDYAQRQISKASKGKVRHVTGQELLGALRDYGLAQFGPLTATVLEDWGVRTCEDFGTIVFNMVDHGLLSKTDEDSMDDFRGIYTFDEAFRKPFLPRAPLAAKPAQSETSKV